jgi:ParB-like chromosome segregation protein Spo0J
MKEAIEKIPISEIKPNPKNPRIIKDDKYKKLLKSIQEFPEMLSKRPIVIDENNIVL